MLANTFDSAQLNQPIAVAIRCREDHFEHPNNWDDDKREQQPAQADGVQKPQDATPIAPDVKIMDS